MGSTNSKELFNEKMKSIFTSEQINGNSGHINLMRIKSQYFEEKFEELNELIETKSLQVEDSEEFKEELYDKLYTFMKKYFSESGSVYFSYNPLDEKVYERVYDNNENVSLFWKTHMLYYVKTSQVWEELEIEDYEIGKSKYTIEFNIDNVDGRLANEKKDIVFELSEVNSETISFNVSYTSTGYGMSASKRDKICNTLKSDYDISTTKNELKNLFSKFKKQNEIDYFINKNADEFLKEQFDFQLKNYMLDDKTMFSEKRLNQIKLIKEIGYELIEFVSKFEEELARIWNKPRAALNSEYVSSYKYLKTNDNIDDLIKNGEPYKQKKEWKKLDLIDSKEEDIFDLLDENPNLPIDTKYFDKNKIRSELRSNNKNLNKIVATENYQGLNTLKRKYKSEVDLIYIDPPYNTGSDGFEYVDNYMTSTWLTFLENRLNLARELLSDKGVIFVQIDDNQRDHLKLLMDEIFGEENFINSVCVQMSSLSGQKMNHVESKLPKLKEYLLIYGTDQFKYNVIETERGWDDEYKYILEGFTKEDYKTYINANPTDYSEIEEIVSDLELTSLSKYLSEKNISDELSWKKNNSYRIVRSLSGESVKSVAEEQESYKLDQDVDVIKSKNGEKLYLVRTDYTRDVDNPRIQLQFAKQNLKKPVGDIWTDISTAGLGNEGNVTLKNGKKPEELLKRIIKLGTDKGDLVMDFFLGSGTTASVANKLDRKYIGLEFKDGVNKRVVPRLKYTVSQGESEMGGFFKYYELEQYEDILENMEYSSSDTLSGFTDSWENYMFMSDGKLAGPTIERDERNGTLNVDLSRVYENVDVPETLSLLLGKNIKSIRDSEVEFEDGSTVSTENPPVDKIKPLLWWGDQ